MRINHRIRAREVRVIGADGSQLGIMDTRKALELAQSQGLDLAEISPTSNPPVCKILDYGKFKYDAKKKAQQSKRNQVVSLLKEVQFRPQTDTHDIDFKVKHILRFLSEGHKVRITVRFRGREMSHPELGHKLLEQVVDTVGPSGIVEQSPKMEGKILAAVLGPGKGIKKAPAPGHPRETSEERPEGSKPPPAAPTKMQTPVKTEG
jgi:translation initiation factor IF-3